MACGVPVLTSSTSALQEIAGGYAYLVDPMDVDAIARGIVDARDRSARGAPSSSSSAAGAPRDFSWDKAAREDAARLRGGARSRSAERGVRSAVTPLAA